MGPDRCRDCERLRNLLADALRYMSYYPDHDRQDYVGPGGDVEADRQRVINAIWTEIGPKADDDRDAIAAQQPQE